MEVWVPVEVVAASWVAFDEREYNTSKYSEVFAKYLLVALIDRGQRGKDPPVRNIGHCCLTFIIEHYNITVTGKTKRLLSIGRTLQHVCMKR